MGDLFKKNKTSEAIKKYKNWIILAIGIIVAIVILIVAYSKGWLKKAVNNVKKEIGMNTDDDDENGDDGDAPGPGGNLPSGQLQAGEIRFYATSKDTIPRDGHVFDRDPGSYVGGMKWENSPKDVINWYWISNGKMDWSFTLPKGTYWFVVGGLAQYGTWAGDISDKQGNKIPFSGVDSFKAIKVVIV
jgi:hypothetical protein